MRTIALPSIQLAGLVLIATLAGATTCIAQPTPELFPPGAVRALSADAANKNRQVRTSGIVLSFLPGKDAIFLHQEGEGALIKLNGIDAPRIGRTVEVSGRITEEKAAHVTAERIRVVDDAPAPPTAKPLPNDKDLSETEPYRWREFQGVVRTATKNRIGWLLEAGANGRSFRIATLRRGRQCHHNA